MTASAETVQLIKILGSISGKGGRSEDGAGPGARSGAADTHLDCTTQHFLVQNCSFLSTLRPRRGTARPPIAVLWVSALASGSLGIHTTRGEGLARSWERPSLVRGLFYNRVLFLLRDHLNSVLGLRGHMHTLWVHLFVLFLFTSASHGVRRDTYRDDARTVR